MDQTDRQTDRQTDIVSSTLHLEEFQTLALKPTHPIVAKLQ